MLCAGHWSAPAAECVWNENWDVDVVDVQKQNCIVSRPFPSFALLDVCVKRKWEQKEFSSGLIHSNLITVQVPSVRRRDSVCVCRKLEDMGKSECILQNCILLLSYIPKQKKNKTNKKKVQVWRDLVTFMFCISFWVILNITAFVNWTIYFSCIYNQNRTELDGVFLISWICIFFPVLCKQKLFLHKFT